MPRRRRFRFLRPFRVLTDYGWTWAAGLLAAAILAINYTMRGLP